MQLSVEKRFSHGLVITGNYTYSSFIDNSDDILGGATNNTLPMIPFNSQGSGPFRLRPAAAPGGQLCLPAPLSPLPGRYAGPRAGRMGNLRPHLGSSIPARPTRFTTEAIPSASSPAAD